MISSASSLYFGDLDFGVIVFNSLSFCFLVNVNVIDPAVTTVNEGHAVIDCRCHSSFIESSLHNFLDILKRIDR